MPSLDKEELHSLVLESIGGDVERHSGVDVEPPFEIYLGEDRPSQCRFYMFTLTPTGAEHRTEDEYRIDLRLPSHHPL